MRSLSISLIRNWSGSIIFDKEEYLSPLNYDLLIHFFSYLCEEFTFIGHFLKIPQLFLIVIIVAAYPNY